MGPSLINILPHRWEIEVFFEDIKDLLGAEHYQLMRTIAIIHFWTLVFCLACFLDEHHARLREKRSGKHLTLGDACRDLQTDHRRNLLEWLEEQFRSGATDAQLYARLFA